MSIVEVCLTAGDTIRRYDLIGFFKFWISREPRVVCPAKRPKEEKGGDRQSGWRELWGNKVTTQ